MPITKYANAFVLAFFCLRRHEACVYITDVSVIIMMPTNDYTLPGELSLEYGLNALVNGAFSSRMALGFPGKVLSY